MNTLFLFFTVFTKIPISFEYQCFFTETVNSNYYCFVQSKVDFNESVEVCHSLGLRLASLETQNILDEIKQLKFWKNLSMYDFLSLRNN